MNLELNKAIVTRHFAVLNGGDPADWDEIMADDFLVHHPFASGTGRDHYRGAAAAYPTVFEGFTTDVHRLVAEDDVVVAYFTTRGRHTGDLLGYAATGREFAFSGMAMYRIANGQLAEAWYAEDTLGWFQQLGLLPADISVFRRVWEQAASKDAPSTSASTATPDDVLAIRALTERYAQAVDAGDTAAFVSVFTADGALVSEFGGTETHFNGRDELAQVVAGAKGVAQTTMHLIGNHLAEIDGDTATGVTYCIAHHLRDDQSDLVMMVRYLDRYARDSGGWLIALRRVIVQWTETRQTDDPSVFADLRNGAPNPK